MEWISVKDSLPEEGVIVLSYGNLSEYYIDYIIYAYEPIWACRLQREEIEVTHWMALPEPPS